MGTSSIEASALLNILIGLICLFIFIYLYSKLLWIYVPKIDPKYRASLSNDINHRNVLESWVYTWSLSEQEYLAICGLDAVMFLRFFSTCLRFCVYSSIIGCMLLLLNYTATSHIESSIARPYEHRSRFDMLSIANVPIQSPRLMLHALATYAFALIAFRLFYTTYADYTRLRHQYLRQQQLHGRGLTCMVDHVPTVSQHSDKTLYTFFDRMYPNQIKVAITLKDTGNLAKEVEDRDKIAHQLEHAYAQMYEHPQHQRPTMRISTCSCETVDTIQHLTMQLDRLNRSISNTHQGIIATSEGVSHVYPSKSVGFITFGSSYLASTAPCVQHNAPPFQYRVRTAPSPHDIDWTAFRQPLHKKWTRNACNNFAFFLLIVFWSVPVTISQSFGNIKNLSERIYWLRWIPSFSPTLTSILEGFLPGAILILFMMLIPMVLSSMAKYQGIPAQSWQQRSVLRKYFIIQVFNFFFNVFAGSALIVIGAIIDHPTDLVWYLGHSLPRLSTFFTTYIMLRAFSGFPLQLLRLGPLLLGNAQKIFMTNTKFEREEIEKPIGIEYGAEYAEHLLIFMIAVAYSPIAPIILPFATLFFALGWFTYRHQLLYVYVQSYECGGHFWPQVFNRMIIGMLLSQLTLIGVLGYVKQAYGPATLLLPLPVITLLFQKYCNKAFFLKSEHLPIEDAIAVDRDRRVTVHVGADMTSGGESDEEKQQEQQHLIPHSSHSLIVTDVHTMIGGFVGEVSPYIQSELRAPVVVNPVLSRVQSAYDLGAISAPSYSKLDSSSHPRASSAAPPSASVSTPLLNKQSDA